MSANTSSTTTSLPAYVYVPAALPPPPPFKDLLKLPRDILEDGFVTDFTLKVENLGTFSNNFSVDVTHSGKVSRGSLKHKVDALEVTVFSDGRFKTDVNFPAYTVGTSNLKAKVSNEFNPDTKDAKLTPSLEVKNEKVNLSLTLESPYSLAITKASDGTQLREVPYVPHKLSLQSAFRLLPGVFSGFSALINSTGKWETFGVRGEYAANPTVIGTSLVKTNNPGAPLETSFYLFHPYTDSSRVGVLLTHSNSFQITGAVESNLNSLTSLKAKASSSGTVGVSLAHRLSNFSKLTGSVTFDRGQQTNFGLTLSLSDKY